MALLGHNRAFGWSLTMFQNDDTDLVALSVDPNNPNRIWHQGTWVDLTLREEMIAVKGADSVVLSVRSSPHGPVINDALPSPPHGKPLALWWSLYHTPNPIVEAFYQLNRADSLDKARQAASLIHAPGLNVVWAHANGDIAWWAAARLPIRPDGVDPSRILDDARGEAHKLGFLPFERNPQEENPARGFVVSANQQPAAATPIPGYYNTGDRARRLFQQLAQDAVRWDTPLSQALQLDGQTDYFARIWRPLADDLRAAASNDEERMWVELLLAWDGNHGADKIAPTLANQLAFDLLQQTMADELGTEWMALLLRTRLVDMALPRLAADAHSPWWDRRDTPAVETRAQVVAQAWRASLAHLKSQLGPVVKNWAWGEVHSLTHVHPLGRVSPLDRVFNVGPFPVAGGREMPNNQNHALAAAPWRVTYGPSTRRVIDFAQPQAAQGVLPVGQSGVWGDPHYSDQALLHAQGRTRGQWLDAPDVDAHTRSVLFLRAP
jgi:penicillin amidase